MDKSLLNLDPQEAQSILERLASFAGPILSKVASDRPSVESAIAPNGWQPDLRYRSLVEKLPVVTFMASLDARRQELYVSPQIESLLGFTQQEWLDNPILWFEQLHPEDRDRWVEEFARTCATGANFRAEYRLLARDGHIVWVQGECQLIRDDDGRPAFLQGIAFDITHLKKAAQVEEAKLAAEAANAAKSEFLARMSHEIRTPLNGVVGMIDLLRATGLTEAQQRYANLGREAADALLTVINDILDFSKIEAGKVEFEAIDFDLHKLVEDLTELLGPVAAKKNLILASFLRPGLPRRYRGDPNRIRQILTNLINNALKFTTRGSVSIRADLQSRDPASDQSMVRVEVTDTGIGIPPDRIDRLFKSFSQVDSSTTRKYGGTGLGLAISKLLVELMGGQIGVSSTPGQGTTFWFTLKLAPALSAEEPPYAAQTLKSTRVLIVESEPMHLAILSEQIDGLFAPSSVVVAPDQAVAALRRASESGEPFAVGIVPFGTPVVDPLLAAAAVDPALAGVKLIGVVGMNDSSGASAVRKAGFCADLHRPLTQSRLLDAVACATLQQTRESAPVVEAEAPRELLKGLHLLVAEDNEMNQFVTRETLSRAGCICDIVGDGAQAVDAITRLAYDGVLMDCQMPGMDGLEASRRIRQHEADSHTARIPIIALTAEAIQGDREKCLAAGMDGYVTKPIDPQALFEAISLLIKPRRAASVQSELTVPATPRLPAIDHAALLERCLRDDAFARQTLEKFERRAMRDVELLRRGIAGGDRAGVARVAHNLRSVAAHVAAEPFRSIVQEIEMFAEHQDTYFLLQKLGELDEETKRCVHCIREILSENAEQAQMATAASR